MRSSNPALRDSVIRRAQEAAAGPSMTVDGTVMKTALLLIGLVAAASITWKMVGAGDASAYAVASGAGIAGFVISVVLGFKPQWSPYLALPFAGVEGLMLGAMSAMFNEAYSGEAALEVGGMAIGGSIVFQAVIATVATSVSLLTLYAFRIIKVTARIRAIASAGFMAVFLVYFATWILGFFGISIPYIHGSGPVGIGFSLLVIGIMALNLLTNFDFVERGSQQGFPKYMEWYGAFAMLVTLIWMYIEFLRLLAKLRSSD